MSHSTLFPLIIVFHVQLVVCQLEEVEAEDAEQQRLELIIRAARPVKQSLLLFLARRSQLVGDVFRDLVEGQQCRVQVEGLLEVLLEFLVSSIVDSHERLVLQAFYLVLKCIPLS